MQFGRNTPYRYNAKIDKLKGVQSDGHHDLEDAIREAEERRQSALQEFRRAGSDLERLRRHREAGEATEEKEQLEHMLSEQRRAAAMTPAQRRAEMRRRTTELGLRVLAMIGIMWLIRAMAEHPMHVLTVAGLGAAASLTTATVMDPDGTDTMGIPPDGRNDDHPSVIEPIPPVNRPLEKLPGVLPPKPTASPVPPPSPGLAVPSMPPQCLIYIDIPLFELCA